MRPGLGALPSPPDSRDAAYALDVAGLALPVAPGQVLACDLRHWFPPIQNQGGLEDCVSYAAVDHLSAVVKRVQGKSILGSHTFTDYLVRSTEHTLGINVGTYPRDAFQHLRYEGLCPMWAWPDGNIFHDISPHQWKSWFQFVSDPTRRMYQGYLLPQDPFYVAAHHKMTTYRAVTCSADAIQAALANDFCVSFGVPLTEEAWGVGGDGYFAYQDTIHVPVVGGHYMTVCGRLASGHWICRNQWGEGWGASGYCFLDPAWFDATPPPGKALVQNYDLYTIHAIAA